MRFTGVHCSSPPCLHPSRGAAPQPLCGRCMQHDTAACFYSAQRIIVSIERHFDRAVGANDVLCPLLPYPPLSPKEAIQSRCGHRVQRRSAAWNHPTQRRIVRWIVEVHVVPNFGVLVHCSTHVVLRLRVRPLLKEQRRHLFVAFQCSTVQRRAFVLNSE